MSMLDHYYRPLYSQKTSSQFSPLETHLFSFGEKLTICNNFTRNI